MQAYELHDKVQQFGHSFQEIPLQIVYKICAFVLEIQFCSL